MVALQDENEVLNHDPVLLSEILNIVPLNQAKVIVDGTVGLGGHLSAFVQKTSSTTRFIALDQDEKHLLYAKRRLGEDAQQCLFIHTNFANLLQCTKAQGIASVDIVFLDLGLASPHVDDPLRGFSYHKEGPLDMRFDRGDQKATAADILNTYSEEDLKHIFYRYGEEQSAPKITRAITDKREKEPFKTTTDLKQLLMSLTKNPIRQNQLFKRIFQALRIEVNKELEVLETVLNDAISLLNKNGYLIVISYHSLEDRIVKNIFKKYQNVCHCPKEMIICQCQEQQQLKLITKRPIIASEEEVRLNPRSRSAKLRIAQKIK